MTFDVSFSELTPFSLFLDLDSLLSIADMPEILTIDLLVVIEFAIESRDRITNYYLKLH